MVGNSCSNTKQYADHVSKDARIKERKKMGRWKTMFKKNKKRGT